jgi:hypothetical protein
VVEYFERELEALARDLAQVAALADDPMVSGRLTEMADEVLALAGQQSADPAIYHSAIIFLHTKRPNIDADPYANDRSPRPTQRN